MPRLIAFAAAAPYVDNFDDAFPTFETCVDEYRSLADPASGLHEDIGAITLASLRYYIDWIALGRDVILSGNIAALETAFDKVHIF